MSIKSYLNPFQGVNVLNSTFFAKVVQTFHVLCGNPIFFGSAATSDDDHCGLLDYIFFPVRLILEIACLILSLILPLRKLLIGLLNLVYVLIAAALMIVALPFIACVHAACFIINNFLPEQITTGVIFFTLNPSTWVTFGFISVGITAPFVGFASAATAGWTALSLLGAASIAAMIAAPLLIVYPIWIIWQDFSEEEVKKPWGVNYNFLTYLTELPERLLIWASSHPVQVTIIAIAVVLSITILLFLTLGGALAPIAATAGFLGGVFSTGFTALGTAVPTIAAVTGALAQAGPIIASVILVATPLVVADNIRRIASVVEEPKIKESKESFELTNNADVPVIKATEGLSSPPGPVPSASPLSQPLAVGTSPARSTNTKMETETETTTNEEAEDIGKKKVVFSTS